jgi:hypothetical protein
MQPIKSNITSTGKCLNPVTTKCVVWDGPDITCLDGTTLCKGQNVETTLFTLATKLCEIYTALSLEDINTCINNINDGTSVSIGPTSSIKEVFSAIIKKLCTLDGRVQSLEDTPCLEQTAVVPACLRTQATSYPSYNPVTFTLPLQYYAELVANSVCGLLIDITGLQNNAIDINQQIDDLWATLAGCNDSSQNFVLPTCTYNWSISPSGDPVTIQTAYSWLEADYCTLRGLLGSDSDITNAINAQCPQLGSENTLAPGLGGTMSSLPSWSDTPLTVSDAITNMWLTVCDMRSYISDVLSLCCKSPCDYLQVGFTPIWTVDGTKVTISFIDPSNPVQYESAAVVPPSPNPYPADGAALPLWVLSQFPTLGQTDIQFILDDGNGFSFNVNTGSTINEWAQAPGQYQINFSGPGVPTNYDQTSPNQTITIIFNYVAIINGLNKQCTFNVTLGLPYICNAPKPYNCNGEIQVSSSTGTDLKVIVKDLVEDTSIIYAGTASGAGSGTDTLEDTVYNNFTGSIVNYVVTITNGLGAGQCRYITTILSTDEIQLDSDWDAPGIDNTSEYEIKNKHYAYSGWGPLGVTTFNVTISTYDPGTFDVNDANTWDVQTQYNVPPATIATAGYQVPNGTLQGNAQYAVIIAAVYPCGQSELVYTTNYNQIATSVTVQQGNPTVPIFSVLNGNVTVNNVFSDGTALPNGFADNSNQALYALALPQIGNVTQIGLTPTPASWLTPLGGGGNNFCICGINTNPDGVTPPGSTITNYAATIGKYRGYEVSLFQTDPVNNYIPIVDSPGNLPYVTNSLDDPTLQFPLNSPQPPPIIVDVPATYPYNNLPLVVRYDPSKYVVNPSPTFHTITVPLIFGAAYTNSTGSNQIFRSKLIVEVMTWNSTTNTYESYTPKRRMEFDTGLITLGPGGSLLKSLSTWSYTNTDPNTPGPGQLSARYGDALRVWLADAGNGIFPFDPASNHTALLNFNSELSSKFSCRVPTIQSQNSNGNMAYTTYTAVDPNPAWYRYQAAIITEDYVITPNISSQR